MSIIASAQTISRAASKDWRGHLLPIVLGGIIAASALAFVIYLLWPTWEVESASGPARLPRSCGWPRFSVSAASVRVKIQHHSGTQERIDLGLAYPSLQPPEAQK